MTATTTQPLFESVTCSRCGGSGHYSYCQRFGTICFKCGGRQVVFTKRGAVAQEFFTRLCSKRADELVVGVDKIKEETGKFYTVTFTGIKNDGSGQIIDGVVVPYYRVETAYCSHGTSPERVFRVAQSAEAKQAKIKEALAYQESLTKTGTVRKVKKSKKVSQ